MSRRLHEQGQLVPDYDVSLEEGGDIGEGLSNQSPNDDDTSNE